MNYPYVFVQLISSISETRSKCVTSSMDCQLDPDSGINNHHHHHHHIRNPLYFLMISVLTLYCENQSFLRQLVDQKNTNLF